MAGRTEAAAVETQKELGVSEGRKGHCSRSLRRGHVERSLERRARARIPQALGSDVRKGFGFHSEYRGSHWGV